MRSRIILVLLLATSFAETLAKEDSVYTRFASKADLVLCVATRSRIDFLTSFYNEEEEEESGIDGMSPSQRLFVELLLACLADLYDKKNLESDVALV